MSINLPRPVLFGLAFLLAILLYWPALNGTPIWDDIPYWFDNKEIVSEYSYLSFWKSYTWPLSNTIQKFLWGMWGKKYFYYHLLSLFIHFTNSFLVYLLGKRINLKYPLLLFLLFLLSPVCVISTSWMIQIKTLLCFFFGISSVLAWYEAIENRRWIIPSWLLFALAVASKSSLITLPGILLLLSYKKLEGKQFFLILPFILISGFGAYRILKSPITMEAMETLTSRPAAPVPLVPPTIPAPAPQEAPKTSQEKLPFAVQPDSPSTPSVTQKIDPYLFMLCSYYYFWQPILPFDNTPVRGHNFNSLEAVEILHLTFILLLVMIFWRDQILLLLIAAHLLLLPFMGLIPAPYMNVTWVSDQHLYAVLPIFYMMWIAIMDKFKFKHLWIISSFFLIYFSYKTFEANKYYKNELTFYEQSLKHNPTNYVVAINLAYAYIKIGNTEKALKIVEEAHELAQFIPELKNRKYYDILMHLYYQLKFPKTKKP